MVGTSTAQFLKLGAGARATGMGEAYTGISDDASAVYWNPSGISQVKNTSILFMHTLWFEEITYDWVSFVQPTGEGSLGVGVQYLSYGDIPETEDITGYETGKFKPNDIAVTMSYGASISDLSIGISGKYVSSKIKNTATAYAMDTHRASVGIRF